MQHGKPTRPGTLLSFRKVRGHTICNLYKPRQTAEEIARQFTATDRTGNHPWPEDAYLKSRETYDAADNEARLLQVYRMSSARMQEALRTQWDKDNPDYPPLIYGASGKVAVEVLSITPVGENTAQVRFTKRLEKLGEPARTGKFYATVSYEFRPIKANAVELVWENPFGFTVTDYRVTAESLESQNMEGSQ